MNFKLRDVDVDYEDDLNITTYYPHKNRTKLPHPVRLELQEKEPRLNRLLEHIARIGDCDLVMTRTDGGVADLDINFQMADVFEKFGQELIEMGKAFTERGDIMRYKIQKYIDEAQGVDKIEYLKTIQNEEVRETLSNLVHPLPVSKSEQGTTWQVKPDVEPPLINVTDSEDSIAAETSAVWNEPTRKKTVYKGNPDTRFVKPKANENDIMKYPYNCAGCEKVFRSMQELRNHVSTHEEEFFTCLKCMRSFRSYKSFKAHTKVHDEGHKPFKCKHCGDQFEYDSTLQNHLQKHDLNYNVCRKCGKKYKYRQKYLDHIQHAHLETKTIECPLCKTFFQTKGSMATHKWKVHGTVRKLVKGYSLVPQADPAIDPDA